MDNTSDGNEEKKDPPPPSKRPRIRNPYEKRTSWLPPISQKPLYGLPKRASPTTTTTQVQDVRNNSLLPESNVQNSATEHSNSAKQQQGNATAIAQPQNPKNVITRTSSLSSSTTGRSIYAGAAPSVSAPPWERLPSQTISFTSAEILSIAECLQHARLYHKQGRSIRCTGVIEEMLEDRHPRIGKVATTGALSGKASPPCLSVSLSDPLADKLWKGRKAPTTGATETAAAAFEEQDSKPPASSSRLWVVFMTPEYTGVVRSKSVGALVTVLGEAIPLEQQQSASARPGGPEPSQPWALRVRMCLPVPATTNLALQWQALQLRRKYFISSSATTVSNDHDDVLRAGCGPPPYA